ncbi:speriolin [Dromaius novaehollandiae]|uniref:speriolin n=1 Tax=Dromaius novaehollandiae TaxID=8790 RepID=UPI00311DC744
METLPRVPSSSAGLAVFACYDQLRREIQALLAENEELKRVVDLLKENQQLRDVIRSRPDMMQKLLPIFTPTPRADGSRSSFFGTAGGTDWGPELPEQEPSFAPVAASPAWPGEHSADSRLSSGPLFPLPRRRTFPGTFPAGTGPEPCPQQLSCPPDALGPGSPPAAAQPPPDPPVPQPPAPLAPIPLPPDLGPPEPPLEQSTPVQPSPDVRPKEYPRKVARAVDRPAPIRESPRPGTHRDAKQQTWERIVGEIAFQLDRRILSSVFPDRARLYGFTVSNIPEKIVLSVLNNSQGGFDERYCVAATRRYVTLMTRLRALGYSPEVHPSFAESVVNAYGILRERPEPAGPDARSYASPGFLRRVVLETVPPALQPDALLLLECLQQLAQDDGKPLFIW